MDAVVLAGGIPLPNEPLYPFTQGIPKAMLDIAGKPMIQWVLDTLTQSKSIDNIVVVGLNEQSKLRCGKYLHFIDNQGGMVDNIRAGAEHINLINHQARHAMFISSDIPTITGEMIEWIINTAQDTDKDIFYNLIPKQVMENRFPGANRTYLHFKDLVFCSGDAHVINLRIVLEDDLGIWRKITNARKSPLKQASLIGFDTVLLYVFRLLTLQKAESTIMKHLNITGKATICPFAEIGMDVDKPRHLEITLNDLQKRNSG